jgi:mannose/fructose/N-acetylgalactosamine-specific phosphotransferase system component IIB
VLGAPARGAAVPIELYRIDDRLIHGQVVVGWGQPLDIAFIVLVDDEVAGSDWEQELYRMGVPPDMEVFFESVESAAAHHNEYSHDGRPGILLTGDIDTMRRLVDAVGTIRTVNLGGIHHRAGRTQRMRYVFLTPDEESALRALARRGVTVTSQDVPAARPVPLEDVLAGKGDT